MLVYSSGREPKAREPDVALFKTESDSLPRRQILADFLESIAKQRMPPKRPSEVTTYVVFSCHIPPNCLVCVSPGKPFLNTRLPWFLSLWVMLSFKKVPDHWFTESLQSSWNVNKWNMVFYGTFFRKMVGKVKNTILCNKSGGAVPPAPWFQNS